MLFVLVANSKLNFFKEKMKRYFIYLAYNGTNYCGWQNQPNAVTVQSTIEHALSTLLRNPIPILGAGRTDSGVHARLMVAHFDYVSELDTEQLCFKLNNFLPKDISILEMKEVKQDAHARFDAISRTYRYYITTEKDPFLYPFKHRIFSELDIDLMNEACKVLFKYEDFTSFSKLHTDVKTNNCTITEAFWVLEGKNYTFKITANRFLRNMVRAIVGTMIDIGRKKISLKDFHQIIESKDRGLAGSSAPGKALFLENIVYPKNIFLN